MAFDKKEYDMQYQKEKLKRVPLDLQKDGDGLTYPKLKAAADDKGESVSGYIKTAILQRMERGE